MILPLSVKLLLLQTERLLPLGFQICLDTSQQYLILNLVLLLSGNELIRLFKDWVISLMQENSATLDC